MSGFIASRVTHTNNSNGMSSLSEFDEAVEDSLDPEK